MTKTLIVGATGLLGNELLRASKKYGNEVHALVRSKTRLNAEKMKTLEAVGATIHVGDLDDYDSLLKACKAVDCVISSVNWQSGDERTLIQAAKDAGVKRFIPSAFGLDFTVATPGSSLIIDNFSAVYSSLLAAGLPYTLIHTGGFFTYWVATLGDMTKLGSPLPPEEVNLYGDGKVKGSFVSESDVATVTVRALNDPKMENQAIHIGANTITQNEMIEMWEKMSGRSVRKISVMSDDIENIIASSVSQDQKVILSVAQLKRSYWIRGESVKHSTRSKAAEELYPDLPFQTVQEGLTRLLHH
ncbi:aromatic alcohol reductase [Cohnella sp. REN36]|uniref:aromatic alcohol reductase n=1 Tax=Cohnella sp. REN36 TaxID=2887347 RepID=UPI001D15285E|nr:aromatic alcohol reductase [Cohnella sp. REN36]MCC3373686.1 aromatic alcohol reductase [Cohnella sp. REN36]